MNEIGNKLGKSTLFRRRSGDCFQNNQKPFTLGVFIKEQIKLSIRKLDGMLLKQIARLTEVNFVSHKVTFW